jgi:hypothetical protein
MEKIYELEILHSLQQMLLNNYPINEHFYIMLQKFNIIPQCETPDYLYLEKNRSCLLDRVEYIMTYVLNNVPHHPAENVWHQCS